jgi:hypothetical protein
LISFIKLQEINNNLPGEIKKGKTYEQSMNKKEIRMKISNQGVKSLTEHLSTNSTLKEIRSMVAIALTKKFKWSDRV